MEELQAAPAEIEGVLAGRPGGSLRRRAGTIHGGEAHGKAWPDPEGDGIVVEVTCGRWAS